ncbi:hypothetical protein LEP1GSC199_3365 [Leptospira vanthielii serovar Holland str. Waz Holland = ATCC 700522]|uniref:Uncharacterized protein n=1 Tax=Leptospira vanthielii serovar Holland str. Waz Holland = ATCC 700522 TaxID=1218591 RepID=N1WA42_9LEPT|nr:hypothetical protein LEP1GSC199_3365 [Leptospira vanthielii serovar Holland str. Waz Holland = ATCC 700522]
MCVCLSTYVYSSKIFNPNQRFKNKRISICLQLDKEGEAK